MMQGIWTLLSLVGVVISSTTIVKIDDTFGDSLTGAVPLYTDINIWYARSNPYDCDVCTAHPDTTQMLFGTWHEEETVPLERAANISFIFSGTTLRIYCTLVGNIVGHVGSTNFVNTRLSFFLDNNSTAIGDFLHNPPPGSTDYLYQQIVFQSSSLPPGNHQMNISTWSDGITGSLILFDFAEYEIGNDDESTDGVHSSQNPGHGHSTSSSLSASASALSSPSSHDSASTSFSTTSSEPDSTSLPNGPSSSHDPSLSLPIASTITSISESSETETTNSSSTSNSHPPNAAAVGAGTTTAVVVVNLLVFWLVYRRQRRRRSRGEGGVDLVETPVKIGRARSMSIEPYNVSPSLPAVPRRVVVKEAKLASYNVARALSWPATLIDGERGVYPPQDALTQLQVDLGTFD